MGSAAARQAHQVFEAPVAVDLERVGQELAHRQPRHPPERLVQLGHKLDVRHGAERLERPHAVAPRRSCTVPVSACCRISLHDLGGREPARVTDVRPHAAQVGAPEPDVAGPRSVRRTNAYARFLGL